MIKESRKQPLRGSTAYVKLPPLPYCDHRNKRLKFLKMGSTFGSRTVLGWFLITMAVWLGGVVAVSQPEKSQTYIVHMDHSQKPPAFTTHESWHRFILESLPSSTENDGAGSLLYSYRHVMQGFSARLTPSQLSLIEKSPAHLGTYKESFGRLYTTRTGEFLGLKRSSGIWPASSYGRSVIIGMIDSGVWPESESFNDRGMPPVPERWKGKCENGTAFSPSACNNKLIGARVFNKGFIASGWNITGSDHIDSARDADGHGTHVSSTAAGSHVLGASHFGYARGTARGVAPAAHVAVYKVHFVSDHDDETASDVLAGMDQAIADGVDIISLSLGFGQTPYFEDVIAIGSLSAVEKGITVVCAAGNDGAHAVTNAAPWIVTVGAGTIDRSFISTMTFGNGLTIEGTSYFPESMYITNAQVYYGGANVSKATCRPSVLDHNAVAGKVVFCENRAYATTEEHFQEVERTRALAAIFLADDLSNINPQKFSFPGVFVSIASGRLIKEYLSRAKNPSVTMRFVLTRVGGIRAPQVASFSSRGPDPINPGILKPDILAPGVDILAAFAPNKPYMDFGIYQLATDYAIDSGTSMATPHVAGVAALLKAVHPDWSPARIRSAIMTTAYGVDNTGDTFYDQLTGLSATPIDFGAGHINPDTAMDPGLVYGLGMEDYVEFLCSLNYTDKQMSAVLRSTTWNCSRVNSDLNYPSFMAMFNNQSSAPKTKNFTRVLTNVGDESQAVYQAVLEIPEGMKVRVEPSTLAFDEQNQMRSFDLSLEVYGNVSGVTYGFLKWVDHHNHVVSSPTVAMSH